MRTFAVFIAGEKFYFQGDLDDFECLTVEQLCKRKATEENISNTPNELFNELISDISSNLGKKISPIKINYVFRIK